MITIDLAKAPPPGLDQLQIDDAVDVVIEDAQHVAYLCHRQAVFSMPIMTAPGVCSVLRGQAVLLSFALKHPVSGTYDPPFYSCIVPAR